MTHQYQNDNGLLLCMPAELVVQLIRYVIKLCSINIYANGSGSNSTIN